MASELRGRLLAATIASRRQLDLSTNILHHRMHGEYVGVEALGKRQRLLLSKHRRSCDRWQMTSCGWKVCLACSETVASAQTGPQIHRVCLIFTHPSRRLLL